MTNNITEYLAEQKRLVEAATPGPWEADCCSAANMVYGQGDSIGVDSTREDAEFIAAARESVPRLVAALEAVVTIRDLVSRPGDAPHVLSSIAGYNRALTVVRAAVEAALEGES